MFSLNPTPQEIFNTPIFEEPLVPIGADPTPAENVALAAALIGYSKRSSSNDFSSLTGFLEAYPKCPWNAALLMNLGLAYYNAAQYSKTLDTWAQAWDLARVATDLNGKAVADRAVGELAYMYARLGRRVELSGLLKAVEGRDFSGPATERIAGAREGLSNMHTRPEIAFRCGPLALHCITLAVDSKNPGTELIHASASTQQGFSLLQLAELSYRLGLYFQMAFREKEAAFVVPSVVHWKVDHFAAIVCQEGDSYLLQDPTFGHEVWVTRETLEAEASGYFLIPPGDLSNLWRTVERQEGETVWGKGVTTGSDPGPHGPCDPHTQGGNTCDKNEDDCKGIAVPRVHLMLASLNINDEPVAYSPPVGPAVRFTVRYNQRESFQPGTFTYSNLGPKWTFDWLSYIRQPPNTTDVEYYIMGGGTRRFTNFHIDDSGAQTWAFQQLDQTKLTRISADTFEMLSRDGTKKRFSKSDGRSPRKTFLTELIDPFGNAVSLTYDANLRLETITDAIGQVTTISYDDTLDFKISGVTDPFGRVAKFEYDTSSGRLNKITDVMGMASEFEYGADDFITQMTTPYGVTSFTTGLSLDPAELNFRFLETVYPDGNKDRVECSQFGHPGILDSDPRQIVPTGMATFNDFLAARNTYYWSKIACAAAYGDYTKAKIYHWVHTTNMTSTAGIPSSIKEPLEARVWYDYGGLEVLFGIGSSAVREGSTNKPAHIGRVLDDGSTQLYTYEYNGFGNVTKMIDPVGRIFSYLYASNGIDLLEVRQTRAGQNQLLSQMTYDNEDKHLLLTSKDAAGQMTTYTYNARGQIITKTNAKNETTKYKYDDKGQLESIDGPLPGASITFIYDGVGRVQTRTDESGYTLTFDYDDLDRLTKISYPDATFVEFTYTRLDRTLMRDRAKRQTSFEYNSVRQMTKQIDPLNRVTLFQWCKCGDLKTLTDPMGRTTTWRHDVQGRIKSKEYADGSKVTYLYENAISRLRQRIDEKLQVTQYNYNRDDTVSEVSYANAAIATPTVSYSYDPSYSRLTAMKDGTGITRYSYHPITPVPGLGAGHLESIDGPSPDDTITYTYDELGRPVERGINGVASSTVFDAADRIITETNALGTFDYTYDGPTNRRLSISYPNGQKTTFSYLDNLNDLRLERITHTQGATPISEFSYGYDVPANRISTWSQKSGTEDPVILALGYDPANQLTSAIESQGANVVNALAYTYDVAGNRLTEQLNGSARQFAYNALNELTTTDTKGEVPITYQWDAAQRLASVRASNRLTSFDYDGFGRRVGIRDLVDGMEVSNRRYVWSGSEICEERSVAGAVVKRFFPQGMKMETGTTVGKYFYTRDHLGSVREVIDDTGSIRARFNYDPYGSQSRGAGDMESDFGFTGHFYHARTALCLTQFRAYDPSVGQWLSRDPLPYAELLQGANLYTYVGNDPVNKTDPTGTMTKAECTRLALGALVLCGAGAILAAKNPIIAAACVAAFIYVQTEICDKIHDPDPDDGDCSF